MTVDKELEILRKYKDGRDLDKNDEAIINGLCLIGLMKKGLSIQRKVVTAKTLELGKRLLM